MEDEAPLGNWGATLAASQSWLTVNQLPDPSSRLLQADAVKAFYGTEVCFSLAS